jgi:hypothetical protein
METEMRRHESAIVALTQEFSPRPGPEFVFVNGQIIKRPRRRRKAAARTIFY